MSTLLLAGGESRVVNPKKNLSKTISKIYLSSHWLFKPYFQAKLVT
jgi:hypothetical protein